MGGGENTIKASRGLRLFGAVLGLAPLAGDLLNSQAPLWTAGDGIPRVAAVTVIIASPPVAILAGCLIGVRRRGVSRRGRNVLVVCQAIWPGLSAWVAYGLNDFATGWYQGNTVGLFAGCAAALVLLTAWALEDRAVLGREKRA